MRTKLHYLYRAYRYRYRVDRAELRFLCSQLQPGQVAVDVGCHKGAYTYWMRRRVGAGGRVVAFEPQPRQVAYLRDAFSTMQYDNVEIVPMAVSDTVGQLPLHMPEHSTHAATLEVKGEEALRRVAALGSCGGGGVEGGGVAPAPALVGGGHPTTDAGWSVVDVTTLDAFFAEQRRGPNFLKIDVEGHELAVLSGASHTIAAHRPALLVECEARHRADGDVRPVFELLKRLGYTGSFFDGGNRRPLAEFDAAVHQKLDARWPGLPPGYVNNFAFEAV